MKISEIVRDVLAECRVEDNVLKLPDRQLDRQTYLGVNKVLESMGGRWNRKLKGHLFDYSPEETLEEVVLSGEYTDIKKELQFFETPESLAVRLCDMAEITAECSVIEPSAGKGRIADEIHKRNPKKLVCFEINNGMEMYLQYKGYDVFYRDFLEVNSDDITADRIVMNPPFSKQQDIDHVLKAYDLLNPGGILVSVMSNAHTFRTNKKSEEFREFLANAGAETYKVPEGTFKESGTMVNTVIVKLRKGDKNG